MESWRFTSKRGSIPAPAGKPLAVGLGGLVDGVYPRACGETALSVVCGCFLAGLSPRLRGNRVPFPSHRWCLGSIPAPAGKPGHNPE